MGKEQIKLADQVQLKLYRSGQLIDSSGTKKPSLLRFLLSFLRRFLT